MEYEKKMEGIAKRVLEWNHEDIENLKTVLDEIPHNLPVDAKFYGVDMASLPSENIPDDIDTRYPVWAMDKHGMCLVGEACDCIESLESIREGL